MFENLTDKLERSFKLIKGEGRITEINVAETLKEIRRALIDADVNYKVAKSFTDEVKQKALGQDVLKSVKPGQMITKIVRDELAQLMGGTATDIKLEGTPAVILIAGLQGSGKTTFSGKLAAMLKSKKGRQVLLVAGDVYRPAAIDQLKVLGGQIGVEVYTEEGNKNPVQIAENAIKYARQHGFNVVIVDTAGRLAVDEAMMQEITAIKAAMSEQVLSLPETAQEALRQYTGFTATRVNFAIRNGKITPQIQETISALDNALASGVMPQSVTLYRNTALSFLGFGLPKNPTLQDLQDLVDLTPEFPIFISTSFQNLHLPGRDTLIQLHVPAGYKGCQFLQPVALPKFKSQDEVLFARGMQYRVLDVGRKDDRYFLEIEVLQNV